jgi:hypothetical protein
MSAAVPAIERAFQLAKSGRVSSTEEIRKVMKRKGYSPGQVWGRSLGKQLVALIKTARAERNSPPL